MKSLPKELPFYLNFIALVILLLTRWYEHANQVTMISLIILVAVLIVLSLALQVYNFFTTTRPGERVATLKKRIIPYSFFFLFFLLLFVLVYIDKKN